MLHVCVALAACAAALFYTGSPRLTAQQKSDGPYRITGTIVNSATGEPLDRASVSIALPRNFATVQAMQTGPDGKFTFDHLPAAKYALTGSRRGFISASYDEHYQYSTAIVTGEGLNSENLVLRLVPDAVISGVVSEDSGDPVENARVSLYRQTNNSGIEKIQMAGATNTDDNGAYEFPNLPPGDYFIAATGHPWYADNGPGMVRFSGTPEAAAKDIQHSPLDLVYPITFYADVTNPDDATPIPLKGGDRVQINFALHPQPAIHLLVHMPVPDDPRQGTPMPGVSREVFGMPEYADTSSRFIAPGLTEISVAPGEYQIHVNAGPTSPAERLTTVDVTSDQSVDAGTGLQTANVTGKLAMASGESLPPNTVVSLTPSDEQGGNGSLVNKDGDFELANIRPGKYRLEGLISGKRFFVAKLAATGAQVDGDRITIGSNPVMIAATVYADPNLEVTGFAKKDGKPAPGAMIVLVPQDPANNCHLFRRDQSDSDGSFALLDVIPGIYTVVAIDDGWPLNWADPNVIGHYLAHGQPVTVTERNAKTTALKGAVEVQPK
ncbi:carboxypeptidase regulatory-like domain-containing protein [Alloacidobacterium sp.]|uniref:carboxypeptidase regulatory-like domain-containing protein n=1 Tax=Alloacidobacterium sp. TaxID=2951999 RepID=UPI002D3D0817|nr:carboxypeptidase regulatory-like domain-containing protein [Alloacidobacterium sp.]HYK36776.1 carboxypeptidase regulatory-like domain-containing protein [Alloacidobacterium sp.]